ncbi:uncharacterized protein LOC118439394 [Folsomia candida]|uniref:F-box domain-containing protein n=1 Tax=Folsomia candida TaxID=158441 RepID=A0A226D4K7_FOLCA|nr:uncharacterized protein LOC118439394 [Folsomia candida]OXA40169.1 hypothetical protein Fcan01_24938 [Folsomia candida]
MESRPEERTPQEIALNNPIILNEIFKHNSTPLKTARLVCPFWNEIVLSLQNTRLGFKLNEKHDRRKDPFSFLALCFSLDDRLAKRISASCHIAVTDFGLRLTHFCDKFSDIVQIMDLSIADEDCLKYIHQVLTNCCPNLTHLQILCEFQNHKQILMDPITPKLKLKSFILNSKVKTPVLTLTNFAQVVVNASPNLREVTLPWGIHPNFENPKFLDSLTIELDGLRPRDINRFKSFELSRILNQIGDQLVSLCFGEYDAIDWIDGFENWSRKEFQIPRKMSKLQKYRNIVVDIFRCDDVLQDFERMPVLNTLVIGKTNSTKSASVHEFLQTIFDAGKIFGGVKDLKILELHDPTLLEGLKTAFPNLVSLGLETICPEDDREEESGMKLGVVLKACGGWGGLKHLNLQLPTYPEEMMNVIQALLGGLELYKGLKTLEILRYHGRDETHDLTEIELDLFKQLLFAMDGMDEVEIENLYFSKESVTEIINFMKLNKISVSKFQIFQGKTCFDYL